MNRRSFLRLGLATAAFGSMIDTLAKAFDKQMTPAQKGQMSLQIITDNPEKALRLAHSFVTSLCYPSVTFTETAMAGTFTGDIAFIETGRLIDYKKRQSPNSLQLLEISHKLRLPRKLTNPSLLTFSYQDSAIEPKYISIFSKNKLIDRYGIATGNKEITVPSNKGELQLLIDFGSVKATNSTCSHKTCIQRGAINRTGQSIICIPNDIRVSIDGQTADGIDSVTY